MHTMEMIINLEAAISSSIPIDKFIFLQAIYEKKEKIVPKLLADIKERHPEKTIKEMLSEYEEEGWLKITDDFEDVTKKWTECLTIREKFVSFITPIDVNWFDEIWNTFPYQVSSRGGLRSLRASTKDSQNYRDAKKKYHLKVKSETKHKDVLARLKGELHERSFTNSITYMHNIITWINNSDWEKYQPKEEEANVSGQQLKPGEEIY